MLCGYLWKNVTLIMFMKNIRIFGLLPLMAMLLLFSCKEQESILLESSIALGQKEMVMNPGGTATLQATLMQVIDGQRVGTSDDKTLKWASSNDSIATVSNGVVTAITGGVVDIIVSTENVDGVAEQRCRVTVQDVFVAGEYGTKTSHVACVWKNNKVLYNLATAADAYANDMVVTDSKSIYAVGSADGAGKLWLDGAEVASYGTSLKAVAVDGSDVYVVGQDGTDAKLWKNGTESLAAANATFNDVCVENGKVVVAGTKDNAAVVWVDGAESVFAATGVVNSVYYQGADLYVAANVGTDSCKVWKNSPAQVVMMEQRVEANVVAADGEKVYVAGIRDKNPNLWIDGTLITKVGTTPNYFENFCLGKGDKGKVYSNEKVGTNGKITPTSLCISLGDIFATGFFFDSNVEVGTYWVNGVPQILESITQDEVFEPWTPNNILGRSRTTAIVVK